MKCTHCKQEIEEFRYHIANRKYLDGILGDDDENIFCSEQCLMDDLEICQEMTDEYETQLTKWRDEEDEAYYELLNEDNDYEEEEDE